MNLEEKERYLRVNLLGPGHRLMKKRIYRAAVSQRLTNSVLDVLISSPSRYTTYPDYCVGSFTDPFEVKTGMVSKTLDQKCFFPLVFNSLPTNIREIFTHSYHSGAGPSGRAV